jgi:hypothetical protein
MYSPFDKPAHANHVLFFNKPFLALLVVLLSLRQSRRKLPPRPNQSEGPGTDQSGLRGCDIYRLKLCYDGNLGSSPLLYLAAWTLLAVRSSPRCLR